MGWLNKAKNAASQAKEKISEVDVQGMKQKAKDKISDVDVQGMKQKAKDKIADVDVQGMKLQAKEKIAEVDVQGMKQKAKDKIADVDVQGVKLQAKEFTAESIQKSKGAIDSIDWDKVTDLEHQKANMGEYWQSGSEKLSKMARSTFEVDKDTMQMVDDLKQRLPVRATTMDDIFDQCRDTAIQRATAAFFLTGAAETLDNNSSEKYENLSESYKEYTDGHNVRDHKNYSNMGTQRAEVKETQGTLGTVEDGYNKDSRLYANDSDIEHVIAAEEVYGSTILRAGTTDEGLLDAINSKDNLVFTSQSVNRSKKSVPLSEFLEDSKPHPTQEGVRILTINGETYEVSESDCQEALAKAKEAVDQHKNNAAVEIGAAAVKAGATMAVQQVVGMIVIETIDIFMEEAKRFSKEFKLFDEAGIVGNVQELNQRLSQRLNERFEERQIWAKARSLGIEAGVSGALSVIPQILISTITKLPAFAIGMIREGTLSCVRSARILASNDPNKLQSISVIMASTASAVIGLYVSRVISAGLSTVPLFNRFNSQVTSILSGLLVTAIPLAAIYLFDKNKKRFSFSSMKKETASAV